MHHCLPEKTRVTPQHAREEEPEKRSERLCWRSDASVLLCSGIMFVTIPTDGHHGAPGVAIHEGSRRIVMSRLGNRLRAAGTAELTGYDTSVSASRTQAILDVTMALFPECGDATKAERWAGFRPMTPDCLPILGRTRYPNLYINSGHGSTGWTYACGSGQVVADLISDKEPEIDLSGLTADRF